MKKQTEEFLKENLKIDVNISEEFKNNLLLKLKEESSQTNNKFNIINIFMDTRKFQIALMSLITLIVLVGSGYLLYTNLNKGEYGKIYVNEGSATLLRDGKDIEIKNNTTLKQGDKLTVADNSIVDVKTECGRIAMDKNSTVEFGDKIKVVKGVVFVSNCESVELETTLANVNVSGAALVSHTGTSVQASSSFISKFLGKAYASSGEAETSKIVSIDGNVNVQKKENNEDIKLEVGKEIVITNSNSNIDDANKDGLNEKFVQNLKEEEDYDFIEDTTKPELTIYSPEEGITTKSNVVTVTLSSNEDGWYYDNEWKDLKANQKVTANYSLKSGTNKLAIVVKDKSYNKTIKYLTVVYTPEAVVELSWVTKPTAQSNGIYMKWTAKNLKGDYIFKVYRNGSLYKTYDISSATQSGSLLDTNTTAGHTYTYQIAVYGKGEFLDKTSAVSVEDKSVENTACSISLYRLTSSSSLRVLSTYSTVNNIKWTLNNPDNCPSYSGYKVVWSADPNPVYPGDDYHYFATGATSGTDQIPSGTWYVRVGLYDGSVLKYSNQIYGTF